MKTFQLKHVDCVERESDEGREKHANLTLFTFRCYIEIVWNGSWYRKVRLESNEQFSLSFIFVIV